MEFFVDENDRVDGVAKVTGKAKYFAEYQAPGLTYGVLVTSTITKGAGGWIANEDFLY